MPSAEPTPDLEYNLSEVAKALFAPGTVDGTLHQIVTLAVDTIDGCDIAGIMVVEDDAVTTLARSSPVVAELDQLQFVMGQGPSLDAVADLAVIYVADLDGDQRWPTFGPAATAIGMRSALSIRLSPRPSSALNLYATLPAAFGVVDRATGLIFATLAGIALESAEHRAAEETRLVNLSAALATREIIGQAQGILMERERITADQAFDVLRRASQHLNIKVKEIARNVVETGEAPGPT